VYVCVKMNACVYVYIYVCVCVFVCLCMYVCKWPTFLSCSSIPNSNILSASSMTKYFILTYRHAHTHIHTQHINVHIYMDIYTMYIHSIYTYVYTLKRIITTITRTITTSTYIHTYTYLTGAHLSELSLEACQASPLKHQLHFSKLRFGEKLKFLHIHK